MRGRPVSVRRWVSQYTVTAVPEGYDENDADLWDITVEEARAGWDAWAVRRGKRCLSSTGSWDPESIPSARSIEFLATHRFDLDTALRLAEAAAPDVTVNGTRAGDLT